MRTFTITACCAVPGLTITKDPYPHVGVGESGRGRVYSRVALGKQDFGPEATKIDRASVIKTQAKGTILIIKEKADHDCRALVLVNIEAGYRGGTSWSGVTTEKTPCKKRGQNVYESECPNCGMKLEYGVAHPDEGMAYDWPAFPSTGVTVLTEGACAQGDAGRMGGHSVKLLLLEPGAMFRVSRAGRLYGAPSKRYVRWTGEKLELGTYDELFKPSEEKLDDAVVL